MTAAAVGLAVATAMAILAFTAATIELVSGRRLSALRWLSGALLLLAIPAGLVTFLVKCHFRPIVYVCRAWNWAVAWGGGLSPDEFAFWVGVGALGIYFAIFGIVDLHRALTGSRVKTTRCPQCGKPVSEGAEIYHLRRCPKTLRSQRNYRVGPGDRFER